MEMAGGEIGEIGDEAVMVARSLRADEWCD
jgi:hypothetical protein